MEEIVTKSLFQAVAGGGISGLLVAGIILMIVHQWIKSITDGKEELAKRVAELETKTIQDLSDTLDEHIDQDNSQRVMTQLEYINANLRNLSTEVKQVLLTTSGHEQRLNNNELYLKNLDTSFQRHKELCNGKTRS